uniref:DNA-directed DNA polymerase n=1 Tax=Pithovirus LCPAC001 TaxID=2506585 RepID=A0A481Z2M4_9VIRU|nr:MAG: DNA polymerase elongation subunit family B [Pithovirus LCPAC001]
MSTPLEVYCYNWEIRKEEIDSELPDKIYAWCLDRKSVPHLLRIENQVCSFILKLPEKYNGDLINWSNELVYKKVIDYISFRIKTSRSTRNLSKCYPVAFKYERKRMLCLYKGNKTYPTLTLYFHNNAQKYNTINYFKNPIKMRGVHSNEKLQYDCLETSINIVRRYMTRVKVKYCQWFRAKVNLPKNRVSYIDNEHIVSEPIVAASEEENDKWALDGQPGIFTFDIECITDTKQMPNSNLIGHQIFSISCMYQRYMAPKNTRTIVNLVLGQAPAPKGEQIRCFTSEKDLLSGFFDLIAEFDPEIITGYNIYGFDNPYLWKRILKRRVVINPRASRLKHQKPFMKGDAWFSKGYGHKSINQIILGGRIDIDVIFHVRASYKLRKNGLDYAAKAILGTGKYDLPYMEMFAKYDQYILGRYLNDQNPNLKTDADFEEAMKGLNEIVTYNSVDTTITYEILEKTGLFTTIKEISNIVGINPENVLNRGQQIRGVSIVYDVCHKFGITMNKIRMDSNIEFEGGYVFDSKAGLWKFVMCIDFASLYPSIILANNICYSTLIEHQDWDEIKEGDYNAIIWNEKKSGVRREYRYVKEHIREGVLPNLLKYLLSNRSRVKKLMAAESDPITKSILNKKQIALKTCANSIYGLTGIDEKMGKLSLKPISASVTACGREYIKRSAKYVEEELGGNVVYGDTDSIMFKIPGVDTAEKCIDTGNRLAKEISNLYPNHIKFEFEKGGKMLAMTKKKYVYWKYDDRKNINGKLNPKYAQYRDLENDPMALEIRGNVLVRRENCFWYQALYRELLYSVLREEALTKAFNNSSNKILNLVQSKVDTKNLVTFRAMGSNYKNNTYSSAKFLECLKSRGRFLSPGERFGYIVEDLKELEIERKIKKGKVYMGEKMRLMEEYEESVTSINPIKIDYGYYLGLASKKNVDQLWQCGYQKQLKPVNISLTEVLYGNVINSALRYDLEGEIQDMLEEADGNNEKVYYMIREFIKDVNRYSPQHHKDIKKAFVRNRSIYITGRDLIKMDIMNVTKTIFKAYQIGGENGIKIIIYKIKNILENIK